MRGRWCTRSGARVAYVSGRRGGRCSVAGRSACLKSFSVAHRPSSAQRPGVAQEGWSPSSLQSGSQTIAGSPTPDVPAAAKHCLRDPHPQRRCRAGTINSISILAPICYDPLPRLPSLVRPTASFYMMLRAGHRAPLLGHCERVVDCLASYQTKPNQALVCAATVPPGILVHSLACAFSSRQLSGLHDFLFSSFAQCVHPPPASPRHSCFPRSIPRWTLHFHNLGDLAPGCRSLLQHAFTLDTPQRLDLYQPNARRVLCIESPYPPALVTVRVRMGPSQLITKL